MSAIRFKAAVRIVGILATSLGMMVGVAAAQPAVPVPPPQPTLFSFLGIPQGLKKLSGKLINPHGKHPKLEPKPPLKALADPANLLSKNPAIKAAAEIKAEEDLAKQKIKAIRYLADIGCGSYPGVKEALIAAMDDPTAKVRLAAVKAVGKASKKNCEQCNQKCCCDEAMVKKLAEIAYEKDDKGCWLEPEEDIREAAKEAIRACCPNCGPPTQPVKVDGGETVPQTPIQGGETVPQPPVEPKPKEARHGRSNDGIAYAADEPAEGGNLIVTDGDATTRLILPEHAGNSSASRIGDSEEAPFRTVSTSPRRLDMEQVSPIAESESGPSPVVTGPVAMRQPLSIVGAPSTLEQITSAWVDGSVRGINPKAGTATLLFPGVERPVAGSRVKVYHQYLLGTERNGELQIVRHQGRETIARPVGETSLARIAAGDEVRFEVSESNQLERQVPPAKQAARPSNSKPPVRSASAAKSGATTSAARPAARPVIKASAEKPSTKARPEMLWVEG